jgi:hypothetical protein
MAIDPQYAERTDYEYDGVGEAPDPQPVARDSEAGPGSVAPGSVAPDSVEPDSVEPESVEPDSVEPESERDDPASDDAPTEADTQRHRKVSLPAAAGPMPGGLLTLRVAVLPIPEEGEIRLLFLSPGEEPPPGVATALLVPPTQRDAELLAKLYDESDAKL